MNITNYNKKYKHLSLDERNIIQRLYNQGISISQISRTLCRSKSTISYEIQKNSHRNQPSMQRQRYGRRYNYVASTAHKKAINKRANNANKNFYYFKKYLENEYIISYSIEQNLFEFKKKYPYACPALKTMYNWYHTKQLQIMKIPIITKKYKKKVKRALAKGKICITNRPNEYSDYNNPGHFEIDTIKCKSKIGGLLTLNERATNKVYSTIIVDCKARTIVQALKHLIHVNGLIINSITSDNGTEFALFRYFIINRKISWFFARPYCSGDRGQNERMNRDIRNFFPKGTYFNKIDESKLQNAIDLINNMPRRKFNGLSANEKAACYNSVMTM